MEKMWREAAHTVSRAWIGTSSVDTLTRRTWTTHSPGTSSRSASYGVGGRAVSVSVAWEITYEYGSPCPYAARNRVIGSVVAVDDVDLLDHILATYEPPHPVRGYYGQQTRGRVRAYLNGGR